MKPIGQIYNELTQNYQALLNGVESKEGTVAYAPIDFFQLEPFYHLMNSIRESQCSFFPTPEEVPGESEIHLCLISDNRLLFARESFSRTVSYDSFFEYEGDMRMRSMVYVNDQEIKPVFAERLINNENGFPHLFESSGMYGYLKVEYFMEDNVIIGKKYSGLNADNSEFMSQLSFYISPENGSVEKILEKPRGDRERIVYEEVNNEKNIDQLITETKELIISTLVGSLKEQECIENEIEFMLLEYTLQSPFPPTVAFAQTAELLAAREEGLHPLSVYNAPDLEYFSEYDKPVIDFYHNGEALFHEVNSRLLADCEYEKYKQMTFDAYYEISETLREIILSGSLIPLAEGFHVTARDFEECNEWDYLEKLLPLPEKSAIEKMVEEHEEASGLPAEDMLLIEEINSEISDEEAKALKIRADFSSAGLQVYYSRDQMFHLKPFHREIKDGEPSVDHELTLHDEYTKKPGGDVYYEYFFSRGNIVSMVFYSTEGYKKGFYYVHEENRIIEYLVDESGKLDQIGRLELKNGLPLYYREISVFPELSEMHFDHEEGRVVSCLKKRIVFHEKLKIEDYIIYRFDYDSDNRLSQITSFYAGDDPERLMPYDEAEAYVSYAREDSYIGKAYDIVKERSFRRICSRIEEMDLKRYNALVIEWNTDLPFPVYRIFLLAHNNEGVAWESIDFGYQSEDESRLYTNVMSYTPKEEGKTLGHYQEELFENLTVMLQKYIKEKIDADFRVFYKKNRDSPEIINERL